MVSNRTGEIVKDFHVLGLSWSPVLLLDGVAPLLFESGFSCATGLYEADLTAVLGTRHPEFLFITHVHWDHCGTAGNLKARFPSLKIAASSRAGEILKRPNALSLIKRLSEEVLPVVASVPEIDATMLSARPFLPFSVDRCLQDGEVIQVEDMPAVEVVATPGHTRDHLSYFIPDRGILVATEASGCLDKAGNIITEFLVDYDAYILSLLRLASLGAEVLCQGHHYVFVGKDEVARFLSRSREEAECFRDRVYQLLDETGSPEEVVTRIKADQWDSNPGLKQAVGAYLINLRARVAHLSEKRGRGTGADTSELP
jgi:2-aminobenzoylacetyl-CoA thioesterase